MQCDRCLRGECFEDLGIVRVEIPAVLRVEGENRAEGPASVVKRRDDFFVHTQLLRHLVVGPLILHDVVDQQRAALCDGHTVQAAFDGEEFAQPQPGAGARGDDFERRLAVGSGAVDALGDDGGLAVEQPHRVMADL